MTDLHLHVRISSRLEQNIFHDKTIVNVVPHDSTFIVIEVCLEFVITLVLPQRGWLPP